MKKNKLGLILVSVYVLISIVATMYAAVCYGAFCGIAMVYLIMPWFLFIMRIMVESGEFGFYFIYFALVALNSVILYFISLGLSRLFNINR